MKRFLTLILAVFFMLIMNTITLAGPSGQLKIFHAGSLTVPFAAIETAFEAKYPEVDIIRKSGGSTKMARLISEEGQSADIMASADYKVIDNNLIPGHAAWNVRFATNQLVLCYTDKSKFADEVNADNWHDILAKKGIEWGHSDPNLDPCGYRSLMVLQLAEKFYNAPGLSERLLANRPERNVRPKAKELVGMLKSGTLDYGWEYLSVAIQHGLKYVTLDDHINLGNYKYDNFYKQAKVKVTGKKEGTWTTKTGKSCTYGITLVKNAPNPDAAQAFLAFLLSPDKGLATLEKMGQPPFIPARVPDAGMAEQLPEAIAGLVEVKD
ncbi:MAG TPA: tungstate ABC transporter substrate-binding protein WtpA [Desulfobacteraceae bacterium]|nr:tungstate ABC transporter substrate-binding protein WtpA [Desulfobacteraceae bacterium]